MSTVKYRMRASQRELGPYRRHELLTGEIFYPQDGYSGYGNGTDADLSAFISPEMKADWRAYPHTIRSSGLECAPRN